MKRWVGVLLGLVALTAAIGALWTYLSDRPTELQLVLAEVDGQVVVLGPQGVERPPEVGQVLGADDHLETRANSRAVLGLGRDTRIRLGPESSLRVTSLGPDGVQVELEDGALQATVRPGAPVRVSNQGREIVATNAEFAVGVSEGILQIEAREGDLGLSGADQTRIEAGSGATIVDRKAVIAPIPEELLLEVRWPAADRTREQVQEVTGVTVPGARVKISGSWGERTGRADAEGRFSIEVPLDEGGNQVTVVATDPLGKAAEVRGTLQTRDTQGPRSKSGVIYGN